MNMWNERYGISEYYYGTEANDFLKENVSLLPANAKILCLAEGEGRNAVHLAKLGHQVTAIDQSSVGLEKLKKLAATQNVSVETIVADLSNFKFEHNSWDAIVSIWCHLPKILRVQVHKSCIFSLRHNGIFLLEAYSPKQLEHKTGGPQSVDLLMQRDDLLSELQGLDILYGAELERNISEGIGHQGKSAVVQIIGKKQ